MIIPHWKEMCTNLEVGQISGDPIQHHDRGELRQGIGSHVFEDTERCYKSSPSFANHSGHAADIRHLREISIKGYSLTLEVNGAAIEASASDKEIPA